MKLPFKMSYTQAVKAGDANMCFVRINPKYKEDAGLHAHEYQHVVQWYKSVLLLGVILLGLCAIISTEFVYAIPIPVIAHNFLYGASKSYRQYCEVDAFKAQLKHYPENVDFFAEFLAKNYGLKLTAVQAKKLLES